ncbi:MULTISPECIES: hypothetical protein [unclassified Nocardioides]|jgi:hypothetical protein|uniref:hypothetical protein n=1 Tax=Nocardioides sp. URHA0032 TaxID=1380388 RepID=UPI000A71364B|nr:hypothetical protein [Nocardioides sp. URHA0032]
MTRSLGSWLAALRRQPAEAELLERGRGWEPLPEDVAEWMGAKPFDLEQSA